MLRNVTLSAEESTIKAIREYARRENTTLNAMFRQWAEQYNTKKAEAEGRERVRKFRETMERIGTFSVGKIPTREERNARR